MTKTTKAKATKATETKVEAATEKLNEGTQIARNLFGAFTLSGKKTFEGVLAFDKALFGIVKDSVTGYVDHGKATMQAKSVNDALELQTAYAHSYIEAAAANTRDMVELAKTKTQEAYAPVTEAISALKADKKAA